MIKIRQKFARDWEIGYGKGQDAWLIKGDFDHFKLTNDLYGALIGDYLLDWTLEVIERELAAAQQEWGLDGLLCNLTGDDVTIYIPPSALTGEDMRRRLVKIREAIRASFFERYVVGTVSLPADYFEDVPAKVLETLRADLEGLDVVFDFAHRRRGFLLLLPVGRGGDYRQSLDTVMRITQSRCGKAVGGVGLRLDWIGDPEEAGGCVFNNGFLDPPSVSFAACPASAGLADGAEHASAYERVSLACQAVLKQCKLERSGVCVRERANGAMEISAPAGVLPIYAAPGQVRPHQVRPQQPGLQQLRWCSERYLREKLYFRQLERPVLFQFNPVYNRADPLPGHVLRDEKYRGNGYGVGLKGINELCGHTAADLVIRLLMVILTEEMQNALARKGLAADRVWMAQFVDRFTVCCDPPVCQLADIVALVNGVARRFNAASEDTKVAYARICAIAADSRAADSRAATNRAGENGMLGYRLFHELALTSLSTRSVMVSADPPIEVRQNNGFTMEEGRKTLERNAFSSARMLAGMMVG